MKHLIAEHGLGDKVSTDSAGTSAYHVGEPPDGRSTEAARERGIDMNGAARQFKHRDFHRFDYVLAMDQSNYEALRESAQTPELQAKVHLFRDFDPDSQPGSEVPDPYYGGPRGFDDVFDICNAACTGFLTHLREAHSL